MKLSEILGILKLDSKLEHDYEVENLTTLDKAGPKDISFVMQEEYLKDLASTKAGAVFLEQSMLEHAPKGLQTIVIEDMHFNLARLSAFFEVREFSKPSFKLLDSKSFERVDIHQNVLAGKNLVVKEGTTIMPNVTIGDDVYIGANVTIMPNVVLCDGVVIGDNTFLYPNVTIYHKSLIGKNVRLHAGVVIGSDGFGFGTSKKTGLNKKIFHNGIAIIEDDVEIGPNTVISRAVFDKTIIGENSKLGELIAVSHNCILGKSNLLVSQVGLAGSTTTGRNVVFGGQAGVGGHVHIADFVQIGAQAGVTKSLLQPGTKWSGMPILPLKDFLRFHAMTKTMLLRSHDKK
ncbi:UDP-3-O-(3-hydroxymyristoyl)glucosamine N-acyltransferase [Helicobacter sp. 11S02629-2]|uniref:UDP-3-O-(3-hydroxymyristoyl)glucosamine N-acyltransferase n=1 Tax=Helicobacter sp. 11S02629-2 TaxID=1476195 RepID=UPI000BA51F4F|nr:UDP-3-O-(3-hydroxymyristoyl)glucosamine N-acyltransferase [Helicobacter sp. 11S02629-2]PAF46022.1 hypothetical protein BKH40_01020 [Helicobacter sp. 11S02629-2]